MISRGVVVFNYLHRINHFICKIYSLPSFSASYVSVLPGHCGVHDYCTTTTASNYHPFNQGFVSVKRCSGVPKLDDALQLFDQMLHRQPTPSIIEINQLITDIVEMTHYSTALSLFNQLKSIGIAYNMSSMNISTNCYFRLNQVNYAFALLGNIFKQGHPLTPTTYTTLIKGLVLVDRGFEVVEVFDKLCQEPSRVVYGTVINGLCKAGHTSIAIELLKFMESGSCKPWVEHYGMIIDSLCKNGMLDKALNIFCKMIEKGILPLVITCNSLIYGLCKSGRDTEAARILIDMEENGISPGVYTCSIMVNYFCKKGSVKDAELVVQGMEQRGLHPHVITCSALIEGYCLRGEMDKARKLLDDMVVKDLVPNIITYNNLISGYCKKKRMDEARQLFLDIQDKGFVPNDFTYNSLIQGFLQSGSSEAASKLFDEMQEMGVNPTLFTYVILIKGMCKNTRVYEALNIFRSLRYSELSELMKDVGLYTILIDGFGKYGQPNLAINLFYDLLLEGLKPHMRTYIAVIRLLCQEGSVDKAKELLTKMKERGCFPDSLTYNVIVRELLKRNRCQAQIFLEEMITRDFWPDSSTYEMLSRMFMDVKQDSHMRTIIMKFKDRRLISNYNSEDNKC